MGGLGESGVHTTSYMHTSGTRNNLEGIRMREVLRRFDGTGRETLSRDVGAPKIN